MYGWIMEVIEHLVLAKFGAQAWTAVKAEAGLSDIPDGGFARHEYYEDDVTIRLVMAASKVAQLDPGDVLTTFGDYFITWMMENGYGSMLRRQGTNLMEFLRAMDDMHRGLQVSLPHLVPPQLSCSVVEDQADALLLEYVSTRQGLAPMMIGLIRAVGREVFDSNYDCKQLKSWESLDDGKTLSHTTFIIENIKGLPLYKSIKSESRLSSFKGKVSTADVKSYQFFQHNAAMAGAWVSILATRVKALTSLFRTPLKNHRHVIPVPQFSYISGAGGLNGLRIKFLTSPLMHHEVNSGANSLVRHYAGPGLRQVPVDLQVCMVPYPGMGGWLLRALADTPNDEILQSVAARAILLATLQQVIARMFFDLLMDAALVAVVTCWSFEPDLRYVGWQFIPFMFCKDIFEYALQMRAYSNRRWFNTRFVLRCLLGIVGCVPHIFVLYTIVFKKDEDDKLISRTWLAVFSCLRWWALLWRLRGFRNVGPHILPILYTLMDMGPFLLVTVLLLMGFISGFNAMLTDSAVEGRLIRMIYIVGFVGEVDDVPEDFQRMDYLQPWLHVFILVVFIFLVNILIGVLSESYDMHQDSAEVIFGRVQAEILLDTTLLLWPRDEFYPCLRWLQSLVSIEMPRDSACSRSYLWVCTPRDKLANKSRLHISKQHTSHHCQLLEQKLDTILEMVRPVEKIAAGHDMITEMHSELDGIKHFTRRMDTGIPPACPVQLLSPKSMPRETSRGAVTPKETDDV